MNGPNPIPDQRSLCLRPGIEASASASRLSADVLLVIFFILRNERRKAERQYKKKLWDWLTVTWICRRWRSVALECPGLWSDILSLDSWRRLCAFLRRSREAELKLDFEILINQGNNTTLYLKGHMHKVREFKALVAGSLKWERWNWLAPRLLEMTQTTKVMELTHSFKDVILASFGEDIKNIPDNLPAIQLDSLTLRCVSLPWTCSLFRGLSELYISNHENGKTIRPSFSQLISILEGCPKLRYLTLDRVCPLDCKTSQTESRSVCMSHLETLTLLFISCSFCSIFFRIVSIKEQARINILVLDDFVMRDSYSWSPPSELLSRRKECRSIEIKLDGFRYTVQPNPSWNGDGVLPSTDTSLSLHISRYLTWIESIDSIRAFLQNKYWQTADTVVLSLAPEENIDKLSWRILLHALPKLTRRMTIILRTPDRVWRTLSENFTLPDALSDVVSEPGSETGFVLPELEQLTIYYVDFSSGRGRQMRRLFLEHIEKRNRNTLKICRVRFLECQWIDYNTVNERDVFVPIPANTIPIGYGGVWDEEDASS